MSDALPDDEPLVPVRQALPRLLAHVHRATLARWILGGLRTAGGVVVKLPAWQLGTRWMTTPRLAAAFARAVTTAAGGCRTAPDGALADEATGEPTDRLPAMTGEPSQ